MSKSSLAEQVSILRDPRQAGKVSHRLVDIVVMAVCGLRAGADGWVEVETWCELQEEWLREWKSAGVGRFTTLIFSLHSPIRLPGPNFTLWCTSKPPCACDTPTTHDRFFLSSLPHAPTILPAIRTQWQVENALHGSLDVTFREDNSRLRAAHAAQNFAFLHRFPFPVSAVYPTKPVSSLNASALPSGPTSFALFSLLNFHAIPLSTFPNGQYLWDNYVACD